MISLQWHIGLVTSFHSRLLLFLTPDFSSQVHLLSEGESHLPSCLKAAKTGKMAAKHKDK